MLLDIFLGLICVSGVSLSVYFFVQYNNEKNNKPKISEEEALRMASSKVQELLEKSERDADNIIETAKVRSRKIQQEVNKLDAEIVEREQNLIKRERLIQQKLSEVEETKVELSDYKEKIVDIREKLKTRLEKISGLSKEEAKKKLMSEIEEDVKTFQAKSIRSAEKKAREEADEKAKEILVGTMQSIATDFVGEVTVSTVKIDDENIKGRIIGREGRNIRAFEKATGVDVIIDEAPDAIALSSFDPLRREIATIALRKLISDGRIHPGSIEEFVQKAKKEVSDEIKKNGQILSEEAGWPAIDLGLLKLLGKMKYRTSYGQSLMRHTIEVIRLGEALAEEVGADVDLVKKACLLHDIGKVLTHKVEGSHHHISGEIARKYELPEKLVNAIEAHHLDIEPQSIEAVIVYLADAISGARPGARKDSYENYIKRVKGIETAAQKIAGNKASEIYAIHGGREVRIIVKPEMIDDDDIVILSKKISDEIEKSQTYPGTVQVTIIRESRAVSMAN
ncbi:ribonuclease Y [Candidatus Dojkabacteria bacterium]|nr:ribonuclease Y [Candidatus Dojkabacteria bacterium]